MFYKVFMKKYNLSEKVTQGCSNKEDLICLGERFIYSTYNLNTQTYYKYSFDAIFISIKPDSYFYGNIHEDDLELVSTVYYEFKGIIEYSSFNKNITAFIEQIANENL